jgi:chromosome segregation ATPase
MESMVALEKHLGAVENKISVLFNSINNIMDYSSKSGAKLINISEDIKELKENLIYKEDLVSQLSVIHDEISNIIKIIETNNKDLSQSILLLNEKIERIDKELEGTKKPRFGKK